MCGSFIITFFFDVITTLGYFVSSYLFGVDIGSVRREETCDERCAWSYRSFIIYLLTATTPCNPVLDECA